MAWKKHELQRASVEHQGRFSRSLLEHVAVPLRLARVTVQFCPLPTPRLLTFSVIYSKVNR